MTILGLMKLQSLKKRGSKLAKPNIQVAILETTTSNISRFEDKLRDINLLPFKPIGIDVFSG